jgi:hypothetical protein
MGLLAMQADPHSAGQLFWFGSSGARGARSESSVSSPAGMVRCTVSALHLRVQNVVILY